MWLYGQLTFNFCKQKCYFYSLDFFCNTYFSISHFKTESNSAIYIVTIHKPRGQKMTKNRPKIDLESTEYCPRGLWMSTNIKGRLFSQSQL